MNHIIGVLKNHNKIDYDNHENKQLIFKAIFLAHCIQLKNNKLMLITNSGGIFIYETKNFKCVAQFKDFSLFCMYSLIQLTDIQFAMASDDTGAITFFDYIPHN